MFEIGKLRVARNPLTGQTFHYQEISRKPEKNPFRKKQLVRATITLEPATFTKKAVVKTEEIYDDFMSAVCKVQQKYPGKAASYSTVDIRPEWLKKELEVKREQKQA